MFHCASQLPGSQLTNTTHLQHPAGHHLVAHILGKEQLQERTHTTGIPVDYPAIPKTVELHERTVDYLRAVDFHRIMCVIPETVVGYQIKTDPSLATRTGISLTSLVIVLITQEMIL